MKELTSAILALTKELKRFNDAREPKSRPRSEAEYFKGAYSVEEIEARETRERLSQLHEAGEESSPSGGPSPDAGRGAKKAIGSYRRTNGRRTVNNPKD